MYRTTHSGEKFNEYAIEWESSSSPSLKDSVDLEFTLDASTTFQTIFGFGGAFTDATAYNLAQIPSDAKTSILRNYFDLDSGSGYTVGRIPMASCDFSTHSYTWAILSLFSSPQ